MKKKSKSIKKTSLILILIFLLSFSFRFYNLKNWLFFGMDQEYEAFLARNIVTFKHFPLIGVNASDTGLYLGPFFIYFASIPFALFSGNPFGWALTASFIGVLVCFLIYRAGKEMFSKRTGIFASLFYSASFLAAFYDRKFWNASFVPLFSLLIGYFLFRIAKKDTNKLIWLAVIFGLSFHIHLSLLIFLPLILYVVWTNRKKFRKKVILVSLLVFFLLQTPIILFDLRHNFTNGKALMSLFSHKPQQASELVMNIRQRTGLFLSTLGRFFWMPVIPDLFLESGQCKELSFFRKNAYPEGILLVIGSIGSFFYWYYKKGCFRWSQRIIIGIFLLTAVIVLFYNRYIFEYYFLYLFPWLAIALGLTADHISRLRYGKLTIFTFASLFVVLNTLTLFSSTFSYSYKDKVAAISFVREYLLGEDYALEAVGDCPRFGGYRYLFSHFIDEPSRSYMDEYFGWLYPDQVEDVEKERLIVLLSLIDSRDKKENIKRWEEEKLRFLTEYDIVEKRRFGKIQVFILAPKGYEQISFR